MTQQTWERRRLNSESVWGEIRKRIEQLDLGADAPPAALDLAALWHRRALELAAAPDRDRELGELLTLVLLRLGADRYAVPITSVREILRVGRLTPVSTAPAFVLGVINLRGVIMTVLDLRVFFGLEPGPLGAEARIIIAEGGGMAVGILVEQVEEIVDLPAAQVKPPLASSKGLVEDYVVGIAAHRDQLVVLIDLEKVLCNPRIIVDEVV
ncbi:MAG: chemotaxis protein CheW [Candidatus Methylomirabilia bacterium]